MLDLDRDDARNARAVIRHHDRALEPLVARLTGHAAAAHPEQDTDQLDVALRSALRCAAAAISDRGAELRFLRGLPHELRPTFAAPGARGLLRDTGRVAREHVAARADRLFELRHPSARDRGLGSIPLGR